MEKCYICKEKEATERIEVNWQEQFICRNCWGILDSLYEDEYDE